jgi:hypothetical protein
VLLGDRLSGGYIRKFSGNDGNELWSPAVGGGAPIYTVVNADANNDVDRRAR